jgi:pilus assembly protein Flp/PilA
MVWRLLCLGETGTSGRFARLRAYLGDETGATAIEYGLIAALVAVAIIAALQALGTSVGDLYDAVSGKVVPKIPT